MGTIDLNELAREAEARIQPRFGEIDAVSEKCTRRIMAAFREHRVSEACFAGSTGYGYDDLGRETLERSGRMFSARRAPWCAWAS